MYSKLFGLSLVLTLWSLDLPLWQALLIPLCAQGILSLARARARSMSS